MVEQADGQGLTRLRKIVGGQHTTPPSSAPLQDKNKAHQPAVAPVANFWVPPLGVPSARATANNNNNITTNNNNKGKSHFEANLQALVAIRIRELEWESECQRGLTIDTRHRSDRTNWIEASRKQRSSPDQAYGSGCSSPSSTIRFDFNTAEFFSSVRRDVTPPMDQLQAPPLFQGHQQSRNNNRHWENRPPAVLAERNFDFLPTQLARQASTADSEATLVPSRQTSATGFNSNGYNSTLATPTVEQPQAFKYSTEDDNSALMPRPEKQESDTFFEEMAAELWRPKRRPDQRYACHICHVAGDHVIHDCPKRHSRPHEELTPYQGNKECFGQFKCEHCKRKWTSWKSSKNMGQDCKKCKKITFPFKQFSHEKAEMHGFTRPHMSSTDDRSSTASSYGFVHNNSTVDRSLDETSVASQDTSYFSAPGSRPASGASAVTNRWSSMLP